MITRILVTFGALLAFSCDSSTSSTEDSASNASSSATANLSSEAGPSSSSLAAQSSSSEVQQSSSNAAPQSSSSEVAQTSSSEASQSSSSETLSSSAAGPYGSITYENQTYKTIAIGTQTWMAENLNYAPPTGNSWCYNGLTQNCTTYGRLYDWSTAMDIDVAYNTYDFPDTVKHRGICPTGWHIPRNSEWKTLVDYAGGTPIAARNLRATSVWRTVDSIVNTDNLYFSALPAGTYVSGYFYIDNQTYWWTATGDGTSNAFYRSMVYDKSKVYSTGMYKNTGYSVRCLKD